MIRKFVVLEVLKDAEEAEAEEVALGRPADGTEVREEDGERLFDVVPPVVFVLPAEQLGGDDAKGNEEDSDALLQEFEEDEEEEEEEEEGPTTPIEEPVGVTIIGGGACLLLLMALLSALIPGLLGGSEAEEETKVMLGLSGVVSDGISILSSFEVFPSFRSSSTT